MKLKLDPNDAAQIAAEQSSIDSLAAMIQKDQQNLELRKELLSRLLRSIIQAQGGKWMPGQCSIATEDGERYLITPDEVGNMPTPVATASLPVNGAAN